jgi:hypothetical protein
VYISDPVDEARVIVIAKEISAKTGGAITIKRADGSLIQTISHTKQ